MGHLWVPSGSNAHAPEHDGQHETGTCAREHEPQGIAPLEGRLQVPQGPTPHDGQASGNRSE